MLNEGSVDFGIAYIEALRGDHDVARRYAEAGLERSRDNSDLIWTIQNLSVLGYLDLVEASADEAVERFSEVARHVENLGIGEPGCLPMRHWQLDALIEAGMHEEAGERADAPRLRGEELDRPHAIGLAARTAARLAGAAGTATERTIAELAATGMTNREIAQRAFVTAKTVEGHLTRIYRELGVRSRAELAASWAPEVSSSP